MYNIIDLTQEVNKDIGVYPGDPRYDFTQITTVENDNYHTSLLSIGTHCGTHIDAPCHFIKDGKAVSELPLEHFVGKALVINAQYNRHDIDSEYIVSQLNKASRAKILIIKTGWERKIGTPEYFTEPPRFDGDISQALSKAGIITLCSDMPTVVNKVGIAAMHLSLFNRGIVIVESLINLDKIKGDYVFFSAAPLKLSECDGSPVRAYAAELTEGFN